MSLLQTIETDLQSAGQWLDREIELIANEVWAVVKTVFTQGEPEIVNSVVAALKEFLPTQVALITTGTTLEVLEQNFIMWALNEGKIVLADVEKLGSVMVQSLIGLTIKSLQIPK